MDVPLVLKNIKTPKGLKGYGRKSSTFSQMTDVVGLSAFFIWSLGCSFSKLIFLLKLTER